MSKYSIGFVLNAESFYSDVYGTVICVKLKET
jgi:hypothetical protein